MFTRLCPLLGRKKWFIVHPTSSTLKYYFPPINFTRRSVGSVRAVGLVLGAKYGSTTSSKLVQGLFMYSPLLFELVGCVLCAAGGRGGAEAPKCAFFFAGGGGTFCELVVGLGMVGSHPPWLEAVSRTMLQFSLRKCAKPRKRCQG